MINGRGPQEGNCHEQSFPQGTEFGLVVYVGDGYGTEQPRERTVSDVPSTILPDVPAAMPILSRIRSHGMSRMLSEADREVGVVL